MKLSFREPEKKFGIVKTRAAVIFLIMSIYIPAFPQSPEMVEMERRARAQGISQEQIDLYKQQYMQQNRTSRAARVDTGMIRSDERAFPEPSEQEVTVDTSADTLMVKKEKIEPHTTTALPFFGYDIFSTTPEAFKPTAVGPVDPGYLVGPGDVLRLSVWGQVEFQYELTINNDGKVFIPVAGQVYVSGIPFEHLQEKIRNLLSRHYSGLTTHPPRTFLDLSVAKLRPIRIFVMGEVKHPGGYTVSSYATVFNALYSVGGPLERGSLRDIKVFRGDKEAGSVDIYEYLLSGRSSKDVRLQNNDVVFVPPRKKTVAINGSVLRPAIYELKKEDNLQALLYYSGSITTGTNVEKAHLYRTIPFDQRTPADPVQRVMDFDLRAYLNGKTDLPLFDKDSVCIVPLAPDLKNFVKLSGAVQYPGIYQCDSLMLSDLIFKYGKIIEKQTYPKRADLIRFNEDRITTKTIPIDLKQIENGGAKDYQLMRGDEVIVYDVNVEKETDLLVTVEGEVRKPGNYLMSINMSVNDALIRAGGFTRKALRTKVDVLRPDSSEPIRLAKVYEVALPEKMDYTGSEGRDFILKDRDHIVVRQDPNYRDDNYVKISGNIRYAGTYPIEKRGERLAEVIEKAGGLMPDAFLEGATVSRGGKRVVVDFLKALHKRRTRENIVLHKGDSIFIPIKPSSVLVHGQVNNQGLFSYNKGTRVSEYLDRAGGIADSALYVVVTFPNGESKKLSRHPSFNNPVVPDGSTILVTKKPYKPPQENKGPSVGEVIRDTLAIVTSAVTIIVLVSQLR